MALRPPSRDVLIRSPLRRAFWNLWFAWQAQNNVIRAFHWQQPEIDFSYGSVFGRRLFTVNAPDLIHQVLVKNHAKYHKGQLFQRLFRPGLGESVLTAEDESWAYRRKMIAPAFHMRALSALETRMRTRIEEATKGLEGILDTEPWATNLALNIALDGLFSGAAGDQTTHLAYHMKRGIDGYGQISTADALNLPGWAPRPGKKRAKAHADQVDTVVYDLIDQRQAAGGTQAHPDLLDLILAARDEETGEGLAREDVRNEVFTFFAAGHDTSANGLQWALYELAQRPDLQAELAAATKAEADWRKWSKMSAVISEVLRLHPPIFALMREAVVEDQLGGQTVPVGALIVIPIYYYHRRPKYWAQPEAFDPSHFAAEVSKDRPRHAYIPFGIGPRVCPGKAMALQTLSLALAALVQAYEIEMLPGQSIEPFAKLTLRPSQSLQLSLKPRA